MHRVLAPVLVGSAAAAGGGTIKLTWSDCGDSSTHGHITSLSPTSVTLGAKTSLAGKGKIDEAIPDATYKVSAKEGFIPIFSHTGDACKPEKIKLPAGAGEIDMKGFKCPISAGAAELDLDLTLSSSIPAKLARVTIELTAQSSSGDKALCVQIKTAPENLIADGEILIDPIAALPTNASSDAEGTSSGHYEDPSNGCRSDEVRTSLPGVNGVICAPLCSASQMRCPTDVPEGVTASPRCYLQDPITDPQVCALFCFGDQHSNTGADSMCGKGASCKGMQAGVGVCMYDDAKPIPHSCPGGSLKACMEKCPAAVYNTCAKVCGDRCRETPAPAYQTDNAAGPSSLLLV